MTEFRLLGVRHHGPGSARAVRRALGGFRPDLVLIEGPPEADGLLPLAGDPELTPPVALLAYVPDDPGRCAFWPFAVFSPEWQAIRYAMTHDVPVRFCDLPAAHSLAMGDRGAGASPGPGDGAPGGSPAPGDGAPGESPVGEHDEPPGGEGPPVASVRRDPIAVLAEAAGYDDPERWWDDVIEHRRDDAPPFAAIAEAMAEVRGAANARDVAAAMPAAAMPAGDGDPGAGDAADDAAGDDGAGAGEDARREAYMRTSMRAAKRAGHQRVAVVCGAWHVPALTEPLPPASHDAALLRGLPKTKVAMTWVPWTHGRLAAASGYRAGVDSPGWYHHLFTASDHVIERWFVAVAGILRDEGQPVSSAHLIEAVRLSHTLATLRGRPLAGLGEVTDATRSVLCDGDDVRLALVQRRVVVGERLGTVPADTPAVPLQADLAAQQRRLRLKPSAEERELDLDLRRDNDTARSRLLHRLRVLGVGWGTPAASHSRNLGTFRETWWLRWQPEYAVALIEAGRYGATVVTAATARVTELAASATALVEVTGLVEVCLLADLTDALPPVLSALDRLAATDTDVAHLAAALPPLARTVRYGDVRGTDTGAVRAVARDLTVRICAGLPAAVTGLADDAARELARHVDEVTTALGLLADDDVRERWLDSLDGVAGRDDLAGPLAGRIGRLLHDAGRRTSEQTARALGLVLTVGVPPSRAAGWIEGFFAGGGLLLLHDEALLDVVDRWLTGLGAEAFRETLPLLRRTFSTFAAGERRSLGERAARGLVAGVSDATAMSDDHDHDRAAAALPTVASLLGLEVAG